MKGFWIIQLLNVSKILKFFARSYVKAVCWIAVLSFFFSVVQLPNNSKEEVVNFVLVLWFSVVSTLFFVFFATLYGSSNLKTKFGKQLLSTGGTLLIYVILGGGSLETFLGLELQRTEALSPFLENYLPGFIAAFVLSLFVKAIVNFGLEKSVTPILLENHSISWQATEWLNPYLVPNKTIYEHQLDGIDLIKVEFRLRYSAYTFSTVAVASLPLE